MPIIRSNAIRIKRFRELKETLRTRRDRLLVGIDIAKAQHVAQVRLAHTRILDKRVTVPNTQAGFQHFWAHLEQRRAETGVREIVFAVEPTGTVPPSARDLPGRPRGRCRLRLQPRGRTESPDARPDLGKERSQGRPQPV